MTSNLRDEARLELVRRELARREFYEYCSYVYEGYPQARHLEVLAWHLQQVERYIATEGREGIGRLMVNMPPRYWKSTSTSVLFPTWVLGRNPWVRGLITSYNGSLAFGFSRRARNHVQGERFRNVFGDRAGVPSPVAVSPDSRSVESWDLEGEHRGGVAAAGVGGGITGKGANLFIVDDPHKDRADAESKASRAAVQEWYRSAAYTRLEKGGAMIIIQTRWHGDDLSGYLLKRMLEDPNADRWVVLAMPAIAPTWADGNLTPAAQLEALRRGVWRDADALGRAPGEPLWEEKHTSDDLALIEANLGGYEYAAQYDQDPQARAGNMIDVTGIHKVRLDQVPDGLTWVRYWDLAVSGGKRADWLVGALVGRSPEGRLYIRHMRHLPGPWSAAKQEIIKQILEDPVYVRQGIEVGGQQAGYYQEFKIDERLQGRIIEPVNPRDVGDKEVRAQVWASRIQDDLIYVVSDGSWDVEGFYSECRAFPLGSHDDRVDGVSGAVQMLGGWMGHMSDVPQDDGGRSLFEERVPDFSFAGMGAIEW